MVTTVAVTTRAQARDDLLERFASRIEVNPALDRSVVSFQGNKGLPIYSWFKYKEGFSAWLVEYVIHNLTPRAGVLLDPFAGSGAALFASRDLGWDATGIEVLPVGWAAVQVRLRAERIDPDRFREAARQVLSADFAAYASPRQDPQSGSTRPARNWEDGNERRPTESPTARTCTY